MKTYCNEDIKEICKIKRRKHDDDEDEEEVLRSDTFRIKVKVEKYAIIHMMNIKCGNMESGIRCFLNEAIKFVKFINTDTQTFSSPVFLRAGLKRKQLSDL